MSLISRWLTGSIILMALLALSACVTPISQQPQPTGRQLRVSAVGDLMLGGSAREKVEQHGYDYPFAKTRHLFANSHLVFANLEGPLTWRGRRERGKRFVFRSPPEKVAPALQWAGFNVVSLANNHSLDYGHLGLNDTMAALSLNGINHVGAGNNLAEARTASIISVAGYKVAVLAYNLTFPENFWASRRRAGTAFGHEAHIRADVAKARKRADVVIVSFHWGREVNSELRPYQPKLARAAIDAGAQLVLGHHPHVLQGIEAYKHGLILYSLGNYAFGSYSQRTTRSAVAQVIFTDNRVSEVRMIPINVNNIEVLFQPTPLNGTAADEVVAELQRLSKPLGTRIKNQNGIAVWRRPPTIKIRQVAAPGPTK